MKYVAVILVVVITGAVSTGLTNLARGRPAYQSSTDEGGVASRAVDGNTNSNWNSKTCTHTEHGRGNWWEVDLGKAVYVSKVILYNRMDCCSDRLKGALVRVGYHARSNSGSVCGYVSHRVSTSKSKIEINCRRPLRGRYVHIHSPLSTILTLCEVEVMGSLTRSVTNLALGKSAYQSTTDWDGNASSAVDGNTATNWASKSCTHTKTGKGQWWEVDLGAEAEISHIILYNRKDACCSKRLSWAYIRVGNEKKTKYNPLCGQVGKTVGKGKIDIQCRRKLKGRYVRIQGPSILSLCEVQVMGSF